jgi:nitroreductase/FMN reductase [NAD(P)H]
VPEGSAPPADSIEALIDRRFGLGLHEAQGVPHNAALAALLDRRVTRKYRPDPVPDAVLDAVLAAAQSAPSKSDLQQYSIVVLTDPGPIGKIADWIGTMPWIKGAPVFLVFCADILRGREICRMHGMNHANDNLDTFLNSAVDAALAMGAAIAAADALGLGSCPISYVRNHIEKVGPLLGLPEAVFPVAGLTLGWPEHRALPSMRLPPSVVVHRGRYHAEALAAELAAYDSRRHAREPLSPGKLKNNDVFGPKDAVTWSENAARQLAVPERFGFRAWLKTRGLAVD